MLVPMSGLPTQQFGPEFFTIIAGMVFAFFGLLVRFAYRSKCKHVKLCCLEVDRDTEEEMVEDVVAMEQGVNLPGGEQIKTNMD